MRFIGYIRVSRVGGREGDSFISPAVQREKIEQYLAVQGHTVVDWSEDLDQPGSKYERAGFQRALEAVENSEADGIAVAALDRFARSNHDGAIALRRLTDAGGAVVCVRESLDSTTAIGRFGLAMMMAFAELELERVRDNWRIARERSIARGSQIARPAFGYRKRDDGKLEPDPATAKVVRELFRRRAAGEEWRSLCRWLDEIAPKDGAWLAPTVRSLIRSRTFLGEARSGDIVNADAHKALVSRPVWEAAQEHRPSMNKRGDFEPALLAGLVRCAGCRYGMPRGAPRERGSARYTCHGRHATGDCPERNKISQRLTDAYVERAFLAELASAPIAAEGTATTDALDAALAKLEHAEAELAIYRDDDVLAAIGKSAYLEGLTKRNQAVDEARTLVARHQSEQARGDLGRRALVDAWPTLSDSAKREYLGAAIDAVFIRRGDPGLRGKLTVDAIAPRIHIAWRDEAPISELPGRGRRVKFGPFLFPDEAPRRTRKRAA